MAFVTVGLPPTCGVDFHCNVGVMSFGVILWLVSSISGITDGRTGDSSK